MYTAWPVLIGTWESKITMPTSGRAAMLRECAASGEDIQKNSLSFSTPKYTGEPHGRPLASAVPSVR